MSGMTYDVIRPGDEPEVQQLFQTVFGKPRPPEMWRWLYEETPAGEGFGVVARTKNGKAVSFAGIVHRPFTLGEKRLSGGQSIDAMTHPDYQRRGLNRGLQERVREEMAAREMQILYGFSNENSTAGILKYHGRQEIGPFPLLARPARLQSLIPRTTPLPPPRPAQIPDATPWISRAEGRIGLETSREYLEWRYRKPGAVYREVSPLDSSNPSGLAILGLRKMAGIRVAFLADSFPSDTLPATYDHLMQAVLGEAKASGCGLVVALAFPGTELRSRLMRRGFLPIPPRFQMEHVVFSVRTVPGAEPTIHLPEDGADWDLSWGAHDLV